VAKENICPSQKTLGTTATEAESKDRELDECVIRISTNP
jgi:hypothetical protein